MVKSLRYFLNKPVTSKFTQLLFDIHIPRISKPVHSPPCIMSLPILIINIEMVYSTREYIDSHFVFVLSAATTYRNHLNLNPRTSFWSVYELKALPPMESCERSFSRRKINDTNKTKICKRKMRQVQLCTFIVVRTWDNAKPKSKYCWTYISEFQQQKTNHAVAIKCLYTTDLIIDWPRKFTFTCSAF